MQHSIITTDAAPRPKRHFSQASIIGNLVFTSGQGPVNPKTGTITTADITEQTRQTLANLGAILAEAGSSLAHVVKVGVFLRHMEDIAAVDAVFREVFAAPPPPRTTIGATLGTLGTSERPGMDIEIDLVAYIPKPA